MESIQKDSSAFLIALGANLPSDVGAPAKTLSSALAALVRAGFRIDAVSRYFRTPAFPSGSAPDYVNACAVLTAALPPEAVLAALHAVEAEFGRTRQARWAARGLDLDLLAEGDRQLPDPETQAVWRALPLDAQLARAPDQLILPHPRLQDRAFVLIPLADVAPGWHHPATGQSVMQMLAALPEAEKAAVSPIQQ